MTGARKPSASSGIWSFRFTSSIGNRAFKPRQRFSYCSAFAYGGGALVELKKKDIRVWCFLNNTDCPTAISHCQQIFPIRCGVQNHCGSIARPIGLEQLCDGLTVQRWHVQIKQEKV